MNNRSLGSFKVSLRKSQDRSCLCRTDSKPVVKQLDCYCGAANIINIPARSYVRQLIAGSILIFVCDLYRKCEARFDSVHND